MPGLNLIQLRGNAFRVLGLPASASQADVFAAARRMRIWASPEEVPDTPWDVSWLGPVARGRADIEQAMAQLSDPVTRLEQRQLWFSNSPPACPRALLPRFRRGAGIEEENSESTAPEPRVAAHDLALGQIAELFLIDPGLRQEAAWRGALAAFYVANRSADYVGWMVKTERDGGFDKAVTRVELKTALRSASTMIGEPLSERARDALERGKIAEAVNIVRTLEALGAKSATIHSFRKGVFDRMEDILVARCNRMTDELHRGITWGAGGGPIMRNRHTRLCKRSEKEVKRGIDPLLKAMKLDALDGAERTQRVGLPAARMLRNLGCGWVRSGRLRHGRKILYRAQAFAVGTSFTQQLVGDVENVNRQLRFWPVRNKPRSKFSKVGLIVLGIVIANGVRGLVNSPSTSITPEYHAPVAPPASPELLQYIRRLHHETPTVPTPTPPVVAPPPSPNPFSPGQIPKGR